MRFRTKTILGVAAIELVMLAILVGSTLSVLRDSNEAELVRRVQLGSKLLAAAAKDAVIAQDLATLDSLVGEATATGQIDYVRIVDAGGNVLSRQGKPAFIDHPFHRDSKVDMDDGIYEWSADVTAGGIRYGEVQMGVATGPLVDLLASARRWAAGIAGVEMLLVALFSWLLGSYLSRQLVALREASDHISAGNYAQRLPVSGSDELAQTAVAFNRMAEQLGESHAIISAENRMRVAAQARLEQALASAEDRARQLNDIFTLLPDGLVSFDARGLVKNANPAFLRMTGLAAETVVGRTQDELETCLRALAETPDQWPGLAPCFAQVGAGGTAQDMAPDQPAQCLLTLRPPHAAVLHLVGVHSDATSVSRLLYLCDVTHETEVDRMKSEFLSHAAHELRTPMTSIFGYTELLVAQDFDAEMRREMLATIHKQTAWLIDILNELLDLARIESRRGRDFNIGGVPLAPLVAETLSVLQIDPQRWPLEINVAASLPPARADAAKLRQTLTNVLANAVKFSPAGGAIGILGVNRVTDGRSYVGLAISDHGIGMTSQEVKRVCERFYRADTSGNIPGTGLGMAIAKEVIDILGGSIDLASAPGSGTSVTLWLPAASADSAPSPKGQQSS